MSMRIDLTCPVEAWKTTLPTQETPECHVTLFNLSSLQVVSVEITLLLSSADGEETAKIIHRGRGLNGAPGRTFQMTVPVEGHHITPERYEITVEKVWFDNASVWRHEKDNTLVYEPNNLHRSAQLTMLRSVAGDMASGYPAQHRGYWVCVCGRPNLDDALVCARCHREKALVFRSFSKEAIDAVVAQREAALAERGRETLQQTGRHFADEKDFVRRKGRHAWVWKLAIVLVVIAGLAFAGVEYGVPYVQYELAMQAYEDGEYHTAAEQFAALPGYKQADYYADLSLFNQTMALLGEDETPVTENEIVKARETLLGLGESDVSAPEQSMRISAGLYLPMCDWLQAEIMFSEGRYDEAEPLYTALGDQYEAPSRLTEIAYIRACEMLENGEWEAARAAFADLGDYKDSATLYLDTWYNPAVQAVDRDDTGAALNLLAEIPGHRDADTLVKKIHYDRGVYLRSEGRINDAAEAFHLARGYEDAEEQANECFYAPADVAYEIMDYEKAAGLFAMIPGYRDADEKRRASILEAAKVAIKQIDYKKAIALLETLPAEDEDAAALIKECTYQPAVNAYVRGDYQEAIELFNAVIDYKDSAEQISKTRYALAQQLHAAGQVEQSAELYAALGEYADAAQKLTAVRYAQAEKALASGTLESIDQAIALFSDMGEYGDAPAKLADAHFAKANLLLQQGEHATARALIADYTEDPRTANVLIACDYAAALALAEAGQAEEALIAFEALGDYADSADKAALMRYEAALALSQTDPMKAVELLEAMGDYADAAIHARELRYQQAEALIATDRAAAIIALRALDDEDAHARANELCYEDAENLIASDRTAAIAAFVALSGYADAADRANALRYEDAVALEESGNWEAAATAFKALGDYSNAIARADALYHDAGLAFADQGEWDKAAAAFEAMSGETDADETVSQLRYEAAESMLAAGSAETAAAAFEALGDFMDAADRAKQIRYEAAETLAKTDWEAGAAAFDKLAGYADAADRAQQIRYEAAETLAKTDWEAGAAAFDKLAGYADAADRANALRYNAAAKVALEGDWRTAAEMYEALGDYSDSADKALQVRYQAAAQMVAKQQWDEAIALYTELAGYADCAERIPMTRYAQAQSVEKTGDYLAAAKLYQALGGYKDAAAKVTAMQEAYYTGPAEAMAKASKEANWQDILNIMSWLDVTELPAKYSYLMDLYHKACYNEGNRLYNEGKPYEAYTYYKELPENYSGMKEKLQKPCYLILGTWEDLQGNRYIFRGEGLCNLNGESVFFNIQDTTLYTGKTVDGLTATHRITGVNKTHAWLYDQRGEKEITIYLTRVTE